MSDSPEFIFDREFDAPREMVWRAWTDPELIPRWYGPGADTIIHKFELKPGGLWLGEMRWGEKSHFSKSVFQEVAPQDRLVWHESTTDPEWNIISNPMMQDWPRVMATVVTFEDMSAKTNLRLAWAPFEASDAENACFAGAMENLGKGWGAGFAKIDELLAELQA